MSHEFQSMLYPTRTAMLDAIAEQWITAGGLNADEDIERWLRDVDHAGLAAEAIEGYGLDQSPGLDPLDDSPLPSHMDREGYDSDDLAVAFGRLATARTAGGAA